VTHLNDCGGSGSTRRLQTLLPVGLFVVDFVPSPATDLEEDGEDGQRSCGGPDDQQPDEDSVDAEGHEAATAVVAGRLLLL